MMPKKSHDKKLASLGKTIISTMLYELINDETIDGNFADHHELIDIIEKYIDKFNFESMIIDYRDSILKNCEYFIRNEDYMFLTLIYAVWTEHYINRFIIDVCRKKRINQECGIGLIRKCSIEDKFSWVLILLDKIKINKRHYERIIKLNTYRNYFVHYKWQPINEQMEKDLIETAQSYNQTVAYLKRFQTNYIYKGNKNKIDNILK